MKVYRDSIEIIDVVVDNKTQLKQSLQGQDLIQANFTLENYFEFKIGDNIQWRNKKYTILDQPSVKKNKQNEFVYSFDLKSDQYRMESALYMLDGQTDFYLLGDLEKFANLIVVNLNRIFGADYYQLGTYPSTEVKNLSFQNTNCFSTLQRITQEFGLEYYFSQDGRTINLVSKIGNDTGLSFQYKYGLQRIERQKVNESNIVTKLYAFGGEKNISNDYGSKRLKIDPLEKNTNLFGVIEGVVTFDDIYPHREGVVSEIDANDIFKFKDSSIDFNVNDQLLEGVVAKVTFNTGQLAGYEFEISEYNDTSKQFTIISYEDTNGLILPNDTLKIEVGDKYVIHEIKMPQTYIDNAEALVQQKGQEYLDKNSLPNVIYNIQPDKRYLRRNTIQLNIGDIITVLDDDFNVSFKTRIINLVQGAGDTYSYSIKVGDQSTVGYLQRVLSNQLDIQNIIAIDKYDSAIRYNQIRKNIRNIDELKESIFDPDGYFDPEKIKPLSIETGMLSVGMKGQQFIIENLLIEPNYDGNAQKIKIGNGKLVHFTIDDTQIKEWNLTGGITQSLDEADPYYIYAKCSKTTNTGVFELSKTQYQTDSTDHYYFLIGLLHSTFEDTRGISLTFGQTTINGKFITTGKIQSIDGYNYIDLDNNKFSLGNGTNGLDWNVTNPNQLTIRGGIVQRSTGESGVIPVHMGDWDGGTEYSLGDQVSYNGSTYQYIYPTPTENKVPTNTTYWTVAAAAGQDGQDGADGANGQDGNDGAAIVYRGDFDQNNLYYNNAQRKDVVKYNSAYYIYKGTNGVALAWNAANWENFGAQFESIATNLLLAENANIADWVIKNGKITSQNEYDGDPRAQLDGANGKITLTSPKETFNASNNPVTYKQNIEIDSIEGRVRSTRSGDASQESAEAILDSDGLKVNYAGIDVNDSSVANMKAGMVADVRGKMNAPAGYGNPLIGVYGKAKNNASSPTPAYGGFFYNLMAKGLFAYGFAQSFNYTVQDSDVYIEMNSSSSVRTLTLPVNSNFSQFQRILFVRAVYQTVTINGNGNNIMVNGSLNSTVNLGAPFLAILWFNSGNWIFNKVGV